MIEYDEALEKVLSHTRVNTSRVVQLKDALGCVIAEDIFTPFPIPRFDSSAVDGYAVRTSDCAGASENPVTLKLAGTISAGNISHLILKFGSAARILTGAIIPSGSDAVVMQEDTTLIREHVLIKNSARIGQNIRRCGAEFAKGRVVLSKGIIISPPIVALLATIGHARVRVHNKPRVALLVTGDELRTAGKKLFKGELFDSNTPGLIAALQAMNIFPVVCMRQKDNPVSIRKSLLSILKKSDIVLTTGGVSVGDKDYIRQIFGIIGVKTVYWSIAMKPGKPNYFGTFGKKLVFGLPGNPVSVMLSFYFLVRPALKKVMGIQEITDKKIQAVIGSTIQKPQGRLEFVRAQLKTDVNGTLVAEPLKNRDSHMLGSLTEASCIIHFPKESTKLSKGKNVSVSLLRWGMI